MVKITTAFSSNPDPDTALQEATSALQNKLSADPSLTLIYYTENYNPGELITALNQQPTTQLHGCSTCRAVMGTDGFHSNNGIALGIWAAHDPEGAYGSALVSMNDAPRLAGREAVEQALNNAQRTGEVPDLIWLSATPGNEESVMLGIQDVVGDDVPIIGGSAADNHITGQWSIIANNESTTDGVAVTVMFPSVEISYTFQSGYSPTSISGTVTKAAGRVVYEIDNRPAAEVYNEWSEGGIDKAINDGGRVLAETSLHPLGRKVTSVGKVDYYKLSHPSAVTLDRALTLFSEVSEGDQLVLMSGSRSSLISRAGRVASSVLNVDELQAADINGALVVFCAGCMLTIQTDMDEVASSINQVLEGKPFLGAFTFGEQGCFVEGGNIHGNLMISMVVFNGE